MQLRRGIATGLGVWLLAGSALAQGLGPVGHVGPGSPSAESPDWLAEMLRLQRNQSADASAALGAKLQSQEIDLAKARSGALASEAWWHKCVNDPGCVAWSTGAGVVPAPNSSGVAAPKEQK